uniref:Calcineurinlike phosphoesterase putative n=1 Tax=Albugo laibachii Nc14 TaxID=890382 RepID=F0WDM1_9STRA|nr:calcineurinlike phosphoesterase putative [Albugo laibachii Nc14]|eukprot:CCA19296.1 calcineurinlike phosphoesterase putative [Albugo laibachii Nc14]
MRVVCVSDTHGLHEILAKNAPFPAGDLFIHAGDFTDTGDRQEVIDFNKWVGTLPYKYKIVIAGNHDSTFDSAFYAQNWQKYGHAVQHDPAQVRALLTNALYLEDQAVMIDGFKVFGSPWQPEFCSWAFNLPRGEALNEKWLAIPSDVDILVTHTPPMGYGDRVCFHNDHVNIHVGDAELLTHITKRIKPILHVFGHVHEGYGSVFDGNTTFFNASSCTHKYAASNPPLLFTLKEPRKRAQDSLAPEYSVMMHQWLRKCSKALTSRTSTGLTKSTSSPNFIALGDQGGRSHSIVMENKHVSSKKRLQGFRVDGTTAGLLFESTLKLRPVAEVHVRAMRYLFHQGYLDESHDPSIRTLESHFDLIRRNHRSLQLSRRYTDGLIPVESVQIKDLKGEKADRCSLHREKRLGNRQGIARLSTMFEEQLCSPRGKECVSVEATSIEVNTVACVLCEYNVPGHEHAKASCAKDAEVPEEKSAQCDEMTTRTNCSKRLSSWF